MFYLHFGSCFCGPSIEAIGDWGSHSLTAPDAAAQGRSILTKVQEGSGTGISATYLINIELMRYHNRLRRRRFALLTADCPDLILRRGVLCLRQAPQREVNKILKAGTKQGALPQEKAAI